AGGKRPSQSDAVCPPDPPSLVPPEVPPSEPPVPESPPSDPRSPPPSTIPASIPPPPASTLAPASGATPPSMPGPPLPGPGGTEPPAQHTRAHAITTPEPMIAARIPSRERDVAAKKVGAIAEKSVPTDARLAPRRSAPGAAHHVQVGEDRLRLAPRVQ